MILCARPELVEGYLRALIKEIVMKRIKKSYTLAAVVIAATVIFVGMTLVNTLYRAKDDAGMMMADAVVELRDTFHRIHKTCVIIDFDEFGPPRKVGRAVSKRKPYNATYCVSSGFN
jgi:hypothetical protein